MAESNSLPITSLSTSSLSLSDSFAELRDAAKTDFNALLIRIAENAGDSDLEKLRFCYKHDLGSERQKLSALNILEKLSEMGRFSYRNVLPLKRLLENIYRYDLIPSVDEYAETYPDVQRTGLQLSQSAVSLPGIFTTHHGTPGLQGTTSLYSLPISNARSLGSQQLHSANLSHVASEESIQDTSEPSHESLMVSGSFEHKGSLDKSRPAVVNQKCTQPSPCSQQNEENSSQQSFTVLVPQPTLPPPSLFSKGKPITSVPQITSIQCTQPESVRPSGDTITRLQQLSNPVSCEESAVSAHSPFKRSNSQPPLYSPQLKRVAKSDKFTRKHSRNSDITLKDDSSSNGSSRCSSEHFVTPQSSPLVVHKCTPHPIDCTEQSAHEQKKVQNGASIVGVPSSPCNIRRPIHIGAVKITSQPISRETLCRRICQLERNDPIQIKENLVFDHGLTIKLLVDPRGTGHHCSLLLEASLSHHHWPVSESGYTVHITTQAQMGSTIRKSYQTVRDSEMMQSVKIRNSPQEITVPKLLAHRTITHEISCSHLRFIITASVEAPIETTDTYGDFVNIDIV